MSKKLSVKEKAALVRMSNSVESPIAESVSNPPSPAIDLSTPIAVVPTTRKSGNSIAMGLGMTGQGTLIADLQRKVDAFDGALPTKKLDPKLIVPSRWANRSELSFDSKAFKDLKEEIESQGGNVQPIKVRPKRDDPGKFEIVFGHRRHRACLELGIDVLAVVEELSDTDLFCQMDRENRARKDLRPIEQGRMYAKALDEGLYPSARKLAEGIGQDLSNMGKALTLARLPAVVLDAFPNVLDLQFRWGKLLSEAIQKDPDVFLARVSSVKVDRPNASSSEVFEYLIEGGGTVPPPLKVKKFQGKDGLGATLSIDAKNGTAALNLKNFTPSQLEAVEKLIKGIVA